MSREDIVKLTHARSATFLSFWGCVDVFCAGSFSVEQQKIISFFCKTLVYLSTGVKTALATAFQGTTSPASRADWSQSLGQTVSRHLVSCVCYSCPLYACMIPKGVELAPVRVYDELLRAGCDLYCHT